MTCIKCGCLIEGRRSDATMCSACAYARKLERRREWYARRRKSTKAATKPCVVCGKDFVCPPSRRGRLQTCSPECEVTNRAAGTAKRKDELEPLRLDGLRAAPLTGHFETHMHARQYLLTAPDGTEYALRNLRLWCDNNHQLFGLTAARVYEGLIRAISRARKQQKSEIVWHGWAVVEMD